MYGVVVESMVYNIAPLDAEEEVKVGFVEVYHSKAVDTWVVGLFEEHHIHYNFPAVEGVPVGESII